ncbi:hypothetical protein EV660_11417 [Roseinatronobacter bogoriensis DSM 18756]|nr:hypothetical protein [Rhodobaca bogoriensis DSM 18756]TDY66058.1 hypothetical protein EV660_11417 [Rhodobaca bogoriensis DSM 18756]
MSNGGSKSYSALPVSIMDNNFFEVLAFEEFLK